MLSCFCFGSGLLLVLLGGEWLESEIAAGHSLLPALEDHGFAIAIALGVVIAATVLLCAERALNALHDAFYD